MDIVPHSAYKSNPKQFYVYTLAYPDGRIFYVGKGSKSRIMNHEADARNRARTRTYHTPKSEIIRQIWREGGQILKQKVAFFDTEDEAYTFDEFHLKSIGKENLVNIDDGGQHGGTRQGAGRPRKYRYLKMVYDNTSNEWISILPDGSEVRISDDAFTEAEQNEF